MSLNTCEHDDWVAVYDTITCPVCSMIDEISELEQTIERLEDQVKELEEEVD